MKRPKPKSNPGALPKRPTQHPYSPDRLRDAVLAALDDAFADDVVVINLNGKTDIADFMVIASAASQRRLNSICSNVLLHLKHNKFGVFQVEGKPATGWSVIDAGAVLIHVLQPETRSFYSLERLWGNNHPDAPALPSSSTPPHSPSPPPQRSP